MVYDKPDIASYLYASPWWHSVDKFDHRSFVRITLIVTLHIFFKVNEVRNAMAARYKWEAMQCAAVILAFPSSPIGLLRQGSFTSQRDGWQGHVILSSQLLSRRMVLTRKDLLLLCVAPLFTFASIRTCGIFDLWHRASAQNAKLSNSRIFGSTVFAFAFKTFTGADGETLVSNPVLTCELPFQSLYIQCFLI
jgi:hypothetical protein